MRVAAFACLLGACSFIGVRSPGSPLPCTRSVALPVTDTVFAAAALFFAAASLVSAVQPVSPDSLGVSQGFGMLGLAIGLPVLGLYGWSAGYGYTTTAQCRAQ
jgi:hypothetical protein